MDCVALEWVFEALSWLLQLCFLRSSLTCMNEQGKAFVGDHL